MITELTFAELARLEPRVAELDADARREAQDGRRYGGWDPEGCFPRHFRWRVFWAVGPHRKRGGSCSATEEVLRSPAAHELVCAHLRGVLGGEAAPAGAAPPDCVREVTVPPGSPSCS